MVDPGHVRLRDAVVPALADGRYRIRLTAAYASGVSGAPPAPGAFDVEIGDLTLDASNADVHPADHASGDFTDELPFVVLRRRTLPWERPGYGRADTPWLALVLTTAAEATMAAPTAGQPGVGLLRCTDVATQTRILPRRAEVGLLAHVRETNLADTALSGGDDDGWQAIVVANRLPRASGVWRLTLVSLDGRDDLLGNQPTLGLTALFTSTFTITATAGSFGDRLAEMTPMRFGDPADSTLTTLDADGSVAVTRQDRAGRSSPARYRPPLVAGGDVLAATSAGAADDTSQIAAFSLGRLLAAADQQMLRDLTAWRSAQLGAAFTASTRAALGLGDAGSGVAARPAVAATPVVDTADELAGASWRRWRTSSLPVAGAHGSTEMPRRPKSGGVG